MQKGRGSRDGIFESRNTFRGFGDFGGFGSRTMMPNLFGGKDPFDDPFFTRPLDSMFSPAFAPRNVQKMRTEKEVVIKELDPDDEEGINNSETGDKDQTITRSTVEPSVEHPDDGDDDAQRKDKNVTYRNDHHRVGPRKPDNFSFQTSRVTYGGVDGAYYTSTRTRKTGADGMVLEDSKEADRTTGQATHRISRGIHDKGHSFTRKLNSDGKIDTMQTLHNLNEDELSGFEEEWKGNNIGVLPGWKGRYGMHRNESFGNGEPAENHMLRCWSLPSLEQGGSARLPVMGSNERSTSRGSKKVVRINIE